MGDKTLRINGRELRVDAEPDTPLLWVLRDALGLTGTKFGCGIGACGACTVHLDGKAARACSVPLEAIGEREITTIEGLPDVHDTALQDAWIAEQVPQCGYCQPGMIMAAAALLAESPDADEEQVRARITNLCRCGTQTRILRAIARAVRGGESGDEETEA